MSASHGVGGHAPRLLDELLAEQRSLSAVELFARRHEAGEVLAAAAVYREHLPADRVPGPGQQWAFRVDLDACTGCKACVTACHNLNGLAPQETWRDVGLLVGKDDTGGVQQTVTTACHHCEDPACLAGCPVQAYEKDPRTGIVHHLDDQCIGCQYCLLMCPYDVPKYHRELGIVRKCDMCADRLAEGEAPACVQGCPNGAISIEVVDRAGGGAVRELLPGLGDAIPDSATTRPTTHYVTRRAPGTLRPVDRDRLRPAPAHDPLAGMLVAMQLSVGTLLFDTVSPAPTPASSLSLAFAALSAALGLGSATLHLGRPHYAFRAFLGWRTSWMSREILAFGAYVPLLALAAVASVRIDFPSWLAGRPFWLESPEYALLPALRGAALVCGVVGTACSIMIYVATRRPAWALHRTAPTFVGTAVGLGGLAAAAAAGVATWLFATGGPSAAGPALLIGLLTLLTKVGVEVLRCAGPRDGADHALARTRGLLRGPLRRRLGVRFGLALGGLSLGTAALAAAWIGVQGATAVFALAALLSFALGEFLERHLYFTAEASPGMPGV